MTKTVAPYGSWPSQITTDLLTKGAVSLGQIAVEDGKAVWTEMRPSEAGRSALVTEGADGGLKDLISEPFNARSWVHEYGGGAFAVGGDVVWFIDPKEKALMRLKPGQSPERVLAKARTAFADFLIDEKRQRLIAVSETLNPDSEATNQLVAIGFDGSLEVLAKGADFYCAPKLSPDGGRLAWIQWHHPNMPWDGTELVEARLDEAGRITGQRIVAGGAEESVFQPEYNHAGQLHYVSDRSGFWNIYRDGEVPLHYAFEAEFGLPHWIFGMRTYGFLEDDTIVCTYSEKGEWRLGQLDPATGSLSGMDIPWCGFDSLVCEGRKAWFVGARADRPDELVEFDIDSGAGRILRSAAELDVPAGDISIGQAVAFPTDGGDSAYAYYYPPSNSGFEGPAEEKPPLIVRSHGGPTGQSTRGLSLKYQYWTSRGFAVLDVNYSGSTGYGRAYRERLNGNWGVADVADCVNGARYCADKGWADPDRLIIAGGSAGGYTTLCALTFQDVFKAGCSSYGIGDLTALANDTHKFESRYLDNLIGRWPDDASIYRSRSPLNATEKLNCPILFLQGEEDKVVPPNQAEKMVNALKDKNLPVAYLLFEGEGHGFRRADTIRRALEAELSFYAQIFDFQPAEKIDRLDIDNL
ncbi:alpha/beta hydrolase family protein [Aestuariispira insulae]|uniref:Dipeptidyl aminopeptidase/acylaminoacyl peptidase n=1 Tax=Aestuariispira insulae TaxID=1461337 RepID=A0A3D9HKF1_9PROT|nr:S9 family peptidase [Aestuariispira insulae]RED49970.1 dipeptidyl aminopeptidase/acylaminoacyl peptidase [Aestuariispira insulae]